MAMLNNQMVDGFSQSTNQPAGQPANQAAPDASRRQVDSTTITKFNESNSPKQTSTAIRTPQHQRPGEHTIKWIPKICSVDS